MNEERIWPVGISALCLLTVALMGISGCVQTKPVPKSASPDAIERLTPQHTAGPNQVGASPPAEPHLPEGSGVIVWAKEFQGQLIEGLDGSVYEPYRRTLIERVQKALVDRGLYTGPVNGILDR